MQPLCNVYYALGLHWSLFRLQDADQELESLIFINIDPDVFAEVVDHIPLERGCRLANV